MRNTELILFILLVSCGGSVLEKQHVSTLFNTGTRITSGICKVDNKIMFGDGNGQFLAYDLKSGAEMWRVNTTKPVKGRPVIKDNCVYLVAGNELSCVDVQFGSLNWRYSAADSAGAGTLDYWDYHQSSPITSDDLVYCGLGNGSLLGFDPLNGSIRFEFHTFEGSPIRSTPVIRDEMIYFGDWNGRIYAVNLGTAEAVWTHQTYNDRPYPTFGMVNTRLVIQDSLLMYGARNPEIRALNIHTGLAAWSFTVDDGGWISGDPLVTGDTLFIGGSDCHRVFALHIPSGELLWESEFLFNNFSEPVIFGDLLVITSGDAYALHPDHQGYGYINMIDKRTGQLVNMIPREGNLFNAMVLEGPTLYLGSWSGDLLAADLEALSREPFDITTSGMEAFEILSTEPAPFQDTVAIRFTSTNNPPVSFRILDIKGEDVYTFEETLHDTGIQELCWPGRDAAGAVVPAGYYYLEGRSGITIRNSLIYKK